MNKGWLLLVIQVRDIKDQAFWFSSSNLNADTNMLIFLSD